MNIKRLSMAVISSLSVVAMTAHANEVLLSADQPTKISFKVAHKNNNGQVVFEESRSVDVNKTIRVPVALDNYDLTGIIITSANGHELPPSANQFDKPKQCSMTTDKNKATGAIDFKISNHSISCRTFGGIFG